MNYALLAVFVTLFVFGYRLRGSRTFPNLSHKDEETSLGIRRIIHVGGGGYSEVWKAEMTTLGTTVIVALKILRSTSSSDRLRKREEREQIWALLQHDNIATLMTIYHLPDGKPVFVSKWYENGTATDFLRRHPEVNPLKILQIYEIASGMQYLHGRGIVHGDLKGINVLIDDDGHARLIDFGLSRFIDSGPGLTTNTRTTLRWCAPEVLCSSDGRATMASDVYSFASTALELITGNIPCATLSDYQVMLNLYAGVGPRFSSARIQYDIPDGLVRILDVCWQMEIGLRPTSTQIKESIQLLIFA